MGILRKLGRDDNLIAASELKRAVPDLKNEPVVSIQNAKAELASSIKDAKADLASSNQDAKAEPASSNQDAKAEPASSNLDAKAELASSIKDAKAELASSNLDEKNIRSQNQFIGKQGEDIAAKYLSDAGIEILLRNWRIKEGEIDIIGKSNTGVYIFYEVKTRRSLAKGDPMEAISQSKALRLQQLALTWMISNGLWGNEYQIDCIGILLTDTSTTIDHREQVL